MMSYKRHEKDSQLKLLRKTPPRDKQLILLNSLYYFVIVRDPVIRVYYYLPSYCNLYLRILLI